MWMAEQMGGEVVGELSAYAPAFKEVYRFILKAYFRRNGPVPEVSRRGDA
jgi:hypothetical protein